MIWQAVGVRVQVSSPSDLSTWRWLALTSLRPADAGLPRRGVLVVDAADRLSPATLARLVDQASACATKLVLVVGGTVPGRGASSARSVDQLADELGRPVPSPPAAYEYLKPGREAVRVDGIAARGAYSCRDTVGHLVGEWRGCSQTTAASMPGRPLPLIVAFGPAEVELLNLVAREARFGPGRQRHEIKLGERSYAVGDELLALRRSADIPAGTGGTVVALGHDALLAEWRCPQGKRLREVSGRQSEQVAYGYATTMPYLHARASSPGGLLVLGDPFRLGARSPSASAGWVTLAGTGVPTLGPGAATMRRRAAVAELAIGWPDEEMLERAGPRPLAEVARRHWENAIKACALERELGAAGLLARASENAHIALAPARVRARQRGLSVRPLGL